MATLENRFKSLISYLDHEMQTDFYFLVMEHCPDGDLRNQILRKQSLRQKFDVDQVIEWSLQVASALKFCHDRKVVHRDLKVRAGKYFFCFIRTLSSRRTSSWFIKVDGPSSVTLVFLSKQRTLLCSSRLRLEPFSTWHRS